MRILKKLTFYSAFGFLIYKLCTSATDGFSMRKIHSDLRTHSEWKTKGTEIPDLSFSYMGHGAQTYAFISSDRKYVLKFYRHNRAGHPLGFLATLLPPPLKKSLLATIEKRQNKRLKDFSSYMLSYHHFAKETGLLHLHLNPSHLPKKVKIYDKIGVEYLVDLSSMQFILQNFAEPFYPSLEKWISHGEIEFAKKQLSQLIALLKTRCQKGIFDKDPDLKTNFGFTEEGPMQFDIGRFKFDPERANPNVYREDLIRITDRLYQWLEERAPALSAHLKEEIAKA
ncbi:MAG: hypothetical protein K940chlam6_00248 [Chlamydiae bacterium]|nr:hypothetical protein [Chlamydiota bacterium]